VIGSPVAIATRLDPSLRAARAAHLQELLEADLIKPHVSHRMSIVDAKEALAAKWNRSVVGNAVVECNLP